MTPEKIIRILDLHSIPHYERGGRIYADSMRSGTALFEEIVDVTDLDKKQLFDWLGY